MSTKFCYQPVFDFNNNSVLEENFYAEEDVQLLCNEINIKVEPTEAMSHDNNVQATDPFLSTTGKYNQGCERYPSEALNSPTNRKKTGGRKERTPRTMLKLMERHRHNERVRHHTLNERLRVICQFVPGSGEDGRETKVVMMQRIISYIAYLENTICHVRNQLGLSKESCLTPLTIQLRRQIDEFAKLAVVPNIDEATRSKRPRTEPKRETPRRYKISSPTVDSTTDIPFYNKPYYNTSQESSQDSMAPTSTFYSMNSDNALPHWLEDPMLHSNNDFESLFDPPVFEKVNHFQPIISSDSFGKENDVTMSEYFFEPIQESFTILSQPTSDSSKQSLVYSPDQTTHDILSESMQQVFGLNSSTETDPDYLTSMVVSPDKVLSISQEAPPSQGKILSSQDTPSSHEPMKEEVPNHSSSLLRNSPSQGLMISTEQERKNCPEEEAGEDMEDNLVYEHPTLIANHEETVTSHMDAVANTQERADENQISIREERNHCLEDVTSSLWSPLHKNKRKQYTPAKLQPLTNFSASLEDSNDVSTLRETPVNFTNMLNSCHRYPKYDQSPSCNVDVINKDEVTPIPQSFKPCTASNTMVKIEPNLTSAEATSRIVEFKTEEELSLLNKSNQTMPPKSCSVAFINIQANPPEISGNSAVTMTNSSFTENHQIIHQVPYSWTFHSMNDIAGKRYNSFDTPQTVIKIHRPQLPQMKENQSPMSNAKLDLRKTSWMNGFMMFSRLNRKNFISANPGVHTSHISKLMGQSWRNMSDEAQQPYKDKAKIFLSDTFTDRNEVELEKKSNRVSIVKICGASKSDGTCQSVPIVNLPNTSVSTTKSSVSTLRPLTTATTLRPLTTTTAMRPLASTLRPMSSAMRPAVSSTSTTQPSATAMRPLNTSSAIRPPSSSSSFAIRPPSSSSSSFAIRPSSISLAIRPSSTSNIKTPSTTAASFKPITSLPIYNSQRWMYL